MTDTPTFAEEDNEGLPEQKEVLAVDAAERIGIRLDRIEARLTDIEERIRG